MSTEATGASAEASGERAALHRDLALVLADLEQIEAFERTARYASALRGWVSDADGTRDSATRDEEVSRLVELMFVRGEDGVLRPREIEETHASHRLIALARTRLVTALLGSASPAPCERDDEHDWTHAIALQRRLRALESHASTSIPAAVLRFMAARCPRTMPLGAVCEAVAMSFANVALRAVWERADVAAAAATIERMSPGKARQSGRPRIARDRATPRVTRAAFGRELVALAIDVWLGRTPGSGSLRQTTSSHRSR